MWTGYVTTDGRDAVMDAIYHDFTHIGLFDKDNNQYATVNMIVEEEVYNG